MGGRLKKLHSTLRFKINGGTFSLGDFWRPPQRILTPPPRLLISRGNTKKFINISDLMFRYCKRLRNILEIPMLSEVKVFKDNPIFVSFRIYFVSTPPVYYETESINSIVYKMGGRGAGEPKHLQPLPLRGT